MLFVLLAVALFSTAATESSNSLDAFILAHKSPLSMYAVENMDLVLEYGIFNVGNKPANKVTLDDRHSFPTQSFEVIHGNLHVHFEQIAAHTNVTHSVIIRPRAFGMFNYTSAQVSYYTGAENLHVTYTNAPGEGYIYRQRDYERKFAPKYVHFLIFLAIACPTTFVAYFLFQRSKARFTAPVQNKRKTN